MMTASCLSIQSEGKAAVEVLFLWDHYFREHLNDPLHCCESLTCACYGVVWNVYLYVFVIIVLDGVGQFHAHWYPLNWRLGLAQSQSEQFEEGSPCSWQKLDHDMALVTIPHTLQCIWSKYQQHGTGIGG
jgi:hypothetical protein